MVFKDKFPNLLNVIGSSLSICSSVNVVRSLNFSIRFRSLEYFVKISAISSIWLFVK